MSGGKSSRSHLEMPVFAGLRSCFMVRSIMNNRFQSYEKICTQYRTGLGTSKVSELLGISRKTVKKVLRERGLLRSLKEASQIAKEAGRGKSHGRVVWDSVCLKYAEGFSSEEVAKALGMPWGTVVKIIARTGITRSKVEADRLAAPKKAKALRRYAWSAEQFSPLTSKGAWVLGLIYGDGCVIRHHGVVRGVNLVGDRDVIEKVKKVLVCETPTKQRPGCWRIDVWDPKFAELLLTFGVTPAKSYTIEWPTLEHSLVSHFVRGLWDSDGCFSWKKRHREDTSFACFEAVYGSMSRNFVASLAAVVRTELGVHGYVSDAKSGMRYFGFSAQDEVRRFGDWIYADADATMWGDRKFLVFARFADDRD